MPLGEGDHCVKVGFFSPTNEGEKKGHPP